MRFIKSDFVDFGAVRLNEKYVSVTPAADREPRSRSGPWLHTILFEVLVLS
jgi:hypothetical protein